MYSTVPCTHRLKWRLPIVSTCKIRCGSRAYNPAIRFLNGPVNVGLRSMYSSDKEGTLEGSGLHVISDCCLHVTACS